MNMLNKYLNSTRRKPWHIATVLCFALLFIPGQMSICRAQNPIAVNSIADLEALNTSSFTGSVQQMAYVNDYYFPTPNTGGGRGGGMFRWWPNTNAMTPPLGSPFPYPDYGRYVPSTNALGNTNGIWERLLQGETPNVKMWGAYGDGGHNDTVAIQNAIYECEGGYQSWSLDLRFPSGIYLITNTLVFWSSLHLSGDMVSSTVILMSSNSHANILETQNAKQILARQTPDWDHWLQVENLKLYFQGTNYTDSCLVVCNPGEANCIHNIQTEGGAYGIRCIGPGAPGLRLRDVSPMEAAIAGVCIEGLNLPGWQGISGGIRMEGLSIDADDPLGTASAILITSNALPGIEINDLHTEQTFGGGVIRWVCSSLSSEGNPAPPVGFLNIKHAGISTATTKDFIALVPVDGTVPTATPSILLEDVQSFPPNVIADYVTSNFLAWPFPTYFAGGRVQLSYEGFNGYGFGPTNNVGMPPATYNRCVVGNTAFSQFYPTNVGWYRVMQGLPGNYPHIAGELVVSVNGYQSTDLQIDVNPYPGSGYLPNLAVNRVVTAYNGGPIIPAVTQARAFKYWDTGGGWGQYVDIFVAIPNHIVTLAHPIQGNEDAASGGIQLISPAPWLGSNTNTNAYYPSGASGFASTNIIVYR